MKEVKASILAGVEWKERRRRGSPERLEDLEGS